MWKLFFFSSHMLLHFLIYFMIESEVTPAPAVIREEPEKIKKWREEQACRLEEKGKRLNSILLSF